MSLRELFRHKLENAEIIPDTSVSSKLMSKLAMQEFLRFNPVRFNIYYLGGILITAIATAIILTSGSGGKAHLAPEEILKEIPAKDSSANIILPVKPALTDKAETFNVKNFEPIKNMPVVIQEIGTIRETTPDTDYRKRYNVTPRAVNNSIIDKRLFTQSSTDNINLKNNFKSEELLFESSVTEGCAPLKVLFQNKLTEYDSCKWIFGDGGSSGNKDAEWIFDVEGEYKVILRVFGSEGLLAASSRVITVFPKPSARFEISPGKVVLPDDEIHFQNYSANAVSYFWNFGDGSYSDLFEPLHRYAKFGNYNISLNAYSEYGCSDSLIVLNAFSGSEYYIEFPNAFIPNPNGPSGGFYSSKSDESAQVFHPSSSGVSDFHLKIFSKLGILLFESRDINLGWDGYFKGQLSNPGVYIWKVRGNFRNGEPFIKMGDITLLKN